jgi:Ca2+:H+ antiporter
MLMLACVALIMPAIFELVIGGGLPSPTDEAEQFPSRPGEDVGRCGRLAARDLCRGPDLLAEDPTDRSSTPSMPRRITSASRGRCARRSSCLAAAGVAVGVMSEILVGSISEASESIGLSPFFVGVIVVAIVGNAAEHWVAIYFAARDKMDLAVNIAIGSAAQIALFAAPVLVLLSLFVGDFPMALVFNGFELGAVVLAVLIAQQVVAEGESTWFEGLQLLAVYAVLALTFYFV